MLHGCCCTASNTALAEDCCLLEHPNTLVELKKANVFPWSSRGEHTTCKTHPSLLLAVTSLTYNVQPGGSASRLMKLVLAALKTSPCNTLVSSKLSRVVLQRCARVAEALEVGIMWVNCSQPCFCQAPWGGNKVCLPVHCCP